MFRAAIVALGFALLAGAPACPPPTSGRSSRGPQAGVVPDDPALPDTWSETENVVWKTDIPGLGWSSPIVWDDHVFLTSAISAGTGSAADQGPVRSGRRHGSRESTPSTAGWSTTSTSRPARSAGSASCTAASADGATHQEQLRVGDAGHRRRARLRLLRQHRPGRRARPERQGRLDARRSAPSTPSRRVRHRRVAGRSTRIASIVVNDNTTQSFIVALRHARPARSSGGSSARSATTGRRRSSGRTSVRTEIVTTGTGRIRSYDLDGKLLWELTGMTALDHPDAVRQARPGLHQLGVSGRARCGPSTPSGPARPATSRSSRTRRATSTSSGTSRCSAPTTPRRWSTATTTTRCSTAASCSATTRGPASRSTAASASRADAERLHGVAVGLQRQDLPAERGRRHVRRAGRSRVQAARQELARTRCRSPRRPSCAAA